MTLNVKKQKLMFEQQLMTATPVLDCSVLLQRCVSRGPQNEAVWRRHRLTFSYRRQSLLAAEL